MEDLEGSLVIVGILVEARAALEAILMNATKNLGLLVYDIFYKYLCEFFYKIFIMGLKIWWRNEWRE